VKRFLLLPLLAACGGQAPEPARPVAARVDTATRLPPADDFRAKPPVSWPDVAWAPPRIDEARLGNGVRVLVVPRPELPIVAVTIAFTRDDRSPPSVASMTSGSLTLGTKKHTEAALSDELQRLGATLTTTADYDAAWLQLRVLTPRAAEALDLAAEVLLTPTFPKDEVERARSRWLTSLQSQNDSPHAIAARASVAALYPPAHPYALPLVGTKQSLTAVTRADLQRWHATVIRPERMTIAFAGDVTRERAIAEAERAFGRFRGAGKAPAAAPAVESAAVPSEPGVVLVDRPGATQSMVYLGRPGVPRSAPDYEAISVMNTIYGGQFSSRLNMNLREKHAYTYGAGSGFDMRRGPGPFFATAAVVREKTGPAISEMLAELARMRDDLPTDDEVEDAKTRLVRQLPAAFETSGQTSSTLGFMAVHGLPLDEPAQRMARLKKITKDDVRAAARARLAPDAFRLVVVGDARVIEPQLAALGAGPVVRRTIDDVMK